MQGGITWSEFNNVVGEIVNLDQIFEEEKARKPITFVNDMKVKTDNDAINLRDKLTMKYFDDIIDLQEGSNPIEQAVEIDYWMRTPDTVDWFMTPIIRIMLEDKTRFKDRSSGTYISTLSYFCDPTYRLPAGYVPDKRFKRLLDEGIPRGINEFYHHFDTFIEIWFGIKSKRGGYTRFSEPVYDLIQKYRDRVFVKHLPMYTRHAFVIESSDSYESMDKSVVYLALDAVFTITSLDMEIRELTPKKLQGKAWKVNTLMCESVEAYLRHLFLKKEGLLRKSNCGTPASFNTRCVIASNQERNHNYETIKLPWGVAMVLFAQEIGGILVREYGWTANQVFHMRALFAKKYDDFIYSLLMKFLRDHPDGGKWGVLHRPPTLERGSHQMVLADDVIKDPRILVIFMSNLITKAFNADFDGDELCWSVLHDRRMERLFEGLKPHYGALDLNTPLTFSSNLGIPKAHAVKLERFLKRHRG